ncbi:hypothetical protein [Streptoalloteichus hindustanus]|uniref:Excalibur calcium-binding domain-containing protein n=1 Tax=Streptoalloteichus hindustanus TaxID=2017 RepID=A0A1M5LYC1_STRHI|nr:hypothetical protein [Streptoalloteichus hindustanus]SHG70092.1 hypothetical protein SAMN05444320_112108 [Streptoalloteichus hindustanus]
MSRPRLRMAGLVCCAVVALLAVAAVTVRSLYPENSPATPPPRTAAAAPQVLPFTQPTATTTAAPDGPPSTARTRPLTASPPVSGPSVPVDAPEGGDGCDHAYGESHECVPWQFPPGTENRCDWLRDHGFGPLTVHGRDRHGLDTNGDGVACGPGDAGVG